DPSTRTSSLQIGRAAEDPKVEPPLPPNGPGDSQGLKSIFDHWFSIDRLLSVGRKGAMHKLYMIGAG
ncbi:MAG TPA: hypothetical protein PKJ51_11500, partial [Methanothrix sp.]|nr:hypothetical protein [Methanothrix sp.]